MGERIRTFVKPRELPRDVHDRAAHMVSAACAEAGHPVTCNWDDDLHVYVVARDAAMPLDVMHKALRLMHDALGLPYEVFEVDPGPPSALTREAGFVEEEGHG